MRLFQLGGGVAQEVLASTAALEADLQVLMERNLEALLGIRLLGSEVSTGPVHGGRIDSLGIDEDGSPVVIEYKRGRDENVLSQALYYLAWVRDHPGDVEALVAARLGAEAAALVDWTSPRIVCVASDFSRYDLHAVREINRRIDLVRYRYFGSDLLALELAASVAGMARASQGARPAASRTVADRLAASTDGLRSLYSELDARLLALGEGVHSVQLQHYAAYRAGSTFASVKAMTRNSSLRLYLRLDPATVTLEAGFTRDVTRIGHHGSGNLEVRIGSLSDVERAEPLLRAAFERVA